MNKLQANVSRAHRNAWARHLKKVMHNPEINGVSRAAIQRDSLALPEAHLSRWGRRFHQDG